MGRVTRHKKSHVGYKKVQVLDPTTSAIRYAIVHLEIPAGVRVHKAFYSTKRRCDSARVVAIENYDPQLRYVSAYDNAFDYVPGEVVEPTRPFTEHAGSSWATDEDTRKQIEDNWMVCASGVHYFTTRAEAEAYNFN